MDTLGPLQQITHEIRKEEVQGKTIRKCDFLDFPSPRENRKLVLTSPKRLRQIAVQIKGELDRHDREFRSVQHKAICFVYTKAEAQFVASMLNSTVGAVDFTSDKKTERNLRKFEEPGGEYRILVTCGKCNEGYDNSDVSVCVFLRIVRSSNMFNQFVGRCTRLSMPIEINNNGNIMTDPVVASIRSVRCFEIGKMWKEYDLTVPDTDPEEEYDSDEEM